jgi:pimeloyl-ACP methyl ester carboxylesterase
MLDTAKVPPPYVLVGTSGGGFITAGYAAAHPDEIAGMVFVDTGKPLSNPPRELVEATAPDNPENVEKRDYLQVERDAWAGRKKVGDIPVTVISVKFSEAAIQEAPFAVEQRAMRQNVERQKGWLILSPRAKQIVVKTSHSVEEDDPKLVIDAIREVVQATG